MAVKKSFLDNYLQEREDRNLTTLLERPKYTHNRAFDEPAYLNLKETSIETGISNKEQLFKNQRQSYDKVTSELTTKLEKNYDEVTTELRQERSTFNETYDKVGTIPTTKCTTKVSPIDNQNYLSNYSSLIGLQRRIVIFLYNSCKIARSSVTNPIAIEYLSEQCQTTKKSAQKTIQRLIEKNIIIRKAYKDGRGGWTQYEITEKVFQEILHEESRLNFTANLGQSYSEVKTQLTTEPKTTLSSSSSFKNITTTLTNEEKKEIPDEWKEIDIEPLEELIRFHQGHIGQLFRHELNIKSVQESIYHFAFDLTENNKAKDIKTDPLGFFMGIMKRSGYYVAPENYESPKERGHRLFLEQEAKKAQKILEAEKNLMNIHFEVWENSLTQEEKIDLVGKDELGPNRAILTVHDKLRQYYKNNHWKEQYQKIINKQKE